jgi:shikimate kinase
MPGAGKSTVGIILAKNLGLDFIDIDVLNQLNQQRTLQEIINESDYHNLRDVEEKEILKINSANHIIATGVSVVYSKAAMAHLGKISKIIFYETNFDTLVKSL